MSVRVEFIGVCTHVRRDPEKGTGSLPVPHRVVLVNARDAVDFKGPGIVPAHVATLRIRGLRGEPGQIPNLEGPWTSWRMNGARLSVTPVRDTSVEYASWNVPRLEELPASKLASGTLAPTGDPEVMVACFEVTGGTFQSTCHDKAHGTVLTIDGGTAPHLVVTPLGMPGIQTAIELQHDADIQIEHVATRHGHADANHFFLHYLIGGKQLPVGAKPYTKDCRGGPTLSGPISLGPDCSNSSYP